MPAAVGQGCRPLRIDAPNRTRLCSNRIELRIGEGQYRFHQAWLELNRSLRQAHVVDPNAEFCCHRRSCSEMLGGAHVHQGRDDVVRAAGGCVNLPKGIERGRSGRDLVVDEYQR